MEDSPRTPAPVPAVLPHDRRNVNHWAAIARTMAGNDAPAYAYDLRTPGAIPPAPRYARTGIQTITHEHDWADGFCQSLDCDAEVTR